MFGLWKENVQTYDLNFVPHRDWCLDLQGLVLQGSYPGERKVSRKTVAKRRAKNAQARKARKAGKGGLKPAKNWTQSWK
jgi:hypothetical protein